jgi:hypothetical protein
MMYSRWRRQSIIPMHDAPDNEEEAATAAAVPSRRRRSLIVFLKHGTRKDDPQSMTDGQSGLKKAGESRG